MRVRDNAPGSGQVQIFERVTGFVFALLAALFVVVVLVLVVVVVIIVIFPCVALRVYTTRWTCVYTRGDSARV